MRLRIRTRREMVELSEREAEELRERLRQVPAAQPVEETIAVAERRHEFATMAALGASLRSIGAFVWSEAVIVLAAALALAALLGWLLAEMLVAMLRHVFDPPPDHLATPWRFLLGLAGAAILGAVLATAVAAIRLRRLPLGALLREQ